MLLRMRQRDPLLGHRDATIVSLHYGLAARSQEVWALRWGSILDSWALVTEVLSDGRVEEWGKTENSTRRTPLPSLLIEDLAQWRTQLEGRGRPTRDIDFIIPGDLTGPSNGVREPDTGARHFSEDQAKSWRRRSFAPAVQAAADEHPELARILGATPYALRRGGIRYACASRTHKRSRGSAAPVCKCSTSTTPSPSRIYGASRHVQPMSSGGRLVPPFSEITPTDKQPPLKLATTRFPATARSAHGSAGGDARMVRRCSDHLRPFSRRAVYTNCSRREEALTELC